MIFWETDVLLFRIGQRRDRYSSYKNAVMTDSSYKMLLTTFERII